MGALPRTGGWVRLEVPASLVGLQGQTLNGMAFTLYGGRAWWDRAGVKRANWQATKYYYFNGQRVAMRKGGVLTYLHGDHPSAALRAGLGSTVLATNEGGSVVGSQGYFAYGRSRSGTGLATEYKFTGQRQDASGLMYFNARYFDPQLGTFISPDTVVPDPSLTVDYNRYMFVRGNPLKYNDPSGHEVIVASSSGIVYGVVVASPMGPAVVGFGALSAVMVYGYVNSTLDLPPIPPIYPETLPGGFTAASPIPGSNTVTSDIPLIPVGDTPSTIIGTEATPLLPQVVEAKVGTSGGPRAGKVMTRAGKRAVIGDNENENGGVTICVDCGVVTTPAQQSRKGVIPPSTETHVDHIIPRSKGGDGSPSNGAVRCRACNLKKSDKI